MISNYPPIKTSPDKSIMHRLHHSIQRLGLSLTQCNIIGSPPVLLKNCRDWGTITCHHKAIKLLTHCQHNPTHNPRQHQAQRDKSCIPTLPNIATGPHRNMMSRSLEPVGLSVKASRWGQPHVVLAISVAHQAARHGKVKERE